MTEIQWKNPPAPKGGPSGAGHIDKVVSALKENPGRWALVAENYTAGAGETYKKRGCEITARSTGEKGPSGNPLYNFYARWPEA